MNNLMLATRAALAVNPNRQWDRLITMARIGAIPGTGVNRACLTALDREARRLLVFWAHDIGAEVSVDSAANLWLRREGTELQAAPVLTGSHMDTQPNGGRFDGIYGVIAGLETLAALHDARIRTRRPIEVVAWTNEEGGRFAPGCMGSMAWSGHKRIEDFADVRDTDGTRFADALAIHLEAEAELPRRPLDGKPYVYVEAHIEQGPLLEADKIRIGVVTGIQGSRWFSVILKGESAHAGTTPHSRRRDAVQAMLRAITALNGLMDDPEDVLRFTVGRIVVEPNTLNSVANRVNFTIDLRHPDPDLLRSRGDAIAKAVRTAVGELETDVQEVFNAKPVVFSPTVIDAVTRAANRLSLSNRCMVSGAFHDAQFVVPVCPTGMIFVPCRGGVSHNPAEYAAPEWLEAGTRALAHTLTEFAETIV